MPNVERTFVSNWKGTGTPGEARAFANVLDKERALLTPERRVIVCPPFTSLYVVALEVQERGLPVAIGVQNMAVDEEVKRTGEIPPALVAEFATHVIIGHSERRNNLSETDDIVARKVELAQKHNLIPIVCVENMDQVHALAQRLGSFQGIIAYEPPAAIGSGKPASPEDVRVMTGKILEVFPEKTVLYGGSVDGNNVASFTDVAGFLVGNKSVDGTFFLGIVRNAH